MYVVTNNRQIEIEDGIRKMLKKIQGYNQSHPKNKNKKKNDRKEATYTLKEVVFFL